jgi:hypothetical protein
MQSFATSATVENSGQLIIGSVPFAPGTVVEVVVSPRRKSPAEFAAAWQQVCHELRRQPQLSGLDDDQLLSEIDQHRAAQ